MNYSVFKYFPSFFFFLFYSFFPIVRINVDKLRYFDVNLPMPILYDFNRMWIEIRWSDYIPIYPLIFSPFAITCVKIPLLFPCLWIKFILNAERIANCTHWSFSTKKKYAQGTSLDASKVLDSFNNTLDHCAAFYGLK